MSPFTPPFSIPFSSTTFFVSVCLLDLGDRDRDLDVERSRRLFERVYDRDLDLDLECDLARESLELYERDLDRLFDRERVLLRLVRRLSVESLLSLLEPRLWGE
jgi:hypothetical protein